MALRPIENALPVASERPKKQSKVQKQSDSVVNAAAAAFLNDENKTPLPLPDASIDYVASEDLKALPDAESKIQGLIEELNSKDWMSVCEALNDSRRLVLYHSAFLLPLLEKVMLVVVKAMKNPRSALCKTSIMTASDIFNAFGDRLLESDTDAAFDQLLLQLLLKASQDKKFVCEEADKALSKMVGSITPLPLLNKLKGYAKHANPRVRAKVAVSISNCVSKLGLEEMKEIGLVFLIQMAMALLNDKLPEAREAARSIVVSVHRAFTENEEQKEEAWQNFCQSDLPPIHAQAIVKIISA